MIQRKLRWAIGVAFSHGVRGVQLDDLPDWVKGTRRDGETVQDSTVARAWQLGHDLMDDASGGEALILIEGITQYLGHGPLCMRSHTITTDELWPRTAEDEEPK